MKLGFVGIGIMGESMSENLLKKAGHPLVVFDMNEEAVQKLVSKGAEKGSSSSDIAKKCDVIFSMLPKSEHVKAVYDEFYGEMKEGQIYVDMSTIDSSISVELSKKVKEKKAIMLDAPVVKSKAAAIEGTLGIYVGGDKSAYEKIYDLLACIGNNIIHLGDNGTGLIMKIIHNTLVAQIQNGVNEMIVLAQKFGFDIEKVMKAISYGGGQNFYLDKKGKAIKERNFQTAFSVENMHKDLHIAKNLVSEINLNLPTVDYVADIYDKAVHEGLGKEDFSATYKIVEKNS